MDLEGRKPPLVVASFEDTDVRHFEWVDDHRLAFDVDQELTGPGVADYGRSLYAVDDDGTHFRQLVEARPAFIKDARERELLKWDTRWADVGRRPHNGFVYVTRPEERSSEKTDYFVLYKLNTRNGHVEEVDAPAHTVGWLVDEKDMLRVVTTHQGAVGRLLARQADGNWKTLAEYDPYTEGGPEPLQVTHDGKLYLSTARQRDTRALYVADLATGAIPEKPLLAADRFDVQPQFIVAGDKVLGMRYHVDAWVTHWFDPDMKALQQTIDAALTGVTNRISVADHGDGRWVLVESGADRLPPVFRVYDREAKKFTAIGAAHPGIHAKDMGSMDLFEYRARDGLPIPAYLTLPPGREPKNLPLIVLVHGGPWVRGGDWAWDPEVQFLASRGYAVLQPEFRGSTGFGWKHFEAGWKQWGLAMQDDLADGARWAIAKGVADPKRICIAGASYGGYAVLMGLVRDPELFRCGVEWVGVSDPRLMYDVDWSDFTKEWKRLGLTALLGDRKDDAELLKKVSPLEQADRIRQPLLMAYGAWDVRVPLIHGEKMRDALKGRNPNVEWVVYGNEGHGWAHVDNRLDFWTRVERFLAKSIPAP
jgi:acetyl esterase/lipase